MAAAIPMLDLWDVDSAHQLSSSLSCRLEAPRGPWAGISRSGPLQGLPALPCPASAAFGVEDHKGCAGLGGTRRSSLAAAQSCGFSAACAGGTTFLAGDARGAPGRGSACVCTQLCSSLRPSECLGSGQEPARCCTTTGSRGCVRPWEGLCCPSACSWCLLLLLAKVFRAGCAAECSWTRVKPQSFSLFLLSNFTEENHFKKAWFEHHLPFLFYFLLFTVI